MGSKFKKPYSIHFHEKPDDEDMTACQSDENCMDITSDDDEYNEETKKEKTKIVNEVRSKGGFAYDPEEEEEEEEEESRPKLFKKKNMKFMRE